MWLFPLFLAFSIVINKNLKKPQLYIKKVVHFLTEIPHFLEWEMVRGGEKNKQTNNKSNHLIF